MRRRNKRVLQPLFYAQLIQWAGIVALPHLKRIEIPRICREIWKMVIERTRTK
jgi:hypothetical protein